jgi:hypothetical protein
MGDVVDFNLARLKRCLPLSHQINDREARIASLVARAEEGPKVVKETRWPMRNELWLSEAEEAGISESKRWPRDPSL